ncbi:MAG: nitrogenase cofactor biosynthesis protein NifB [Methanomassiliicoccaceae archaeon]|nr:nitrogenase cofactor biosynthesis protein NifB [Methanomassiliicoccaceae archaeon]
MEDKLANALESHPCYNESAHSKFARMHLPVAPKCNIQCNYCNRRYDCSNESRPGVTSELLTPSEAKEKVRAVKEKIPELSVVAVAGPGDPLANDETMETISLINEEFPELTLCISTNGLMLPEYAEMLYGKGVRFITVTMNSYDPEISSKIYEFVLWKGKKLQGKEASKRLLKNQLDGIEKCIGLGMLVKVNIVLIPGINDDHIPDLVKKVKELGAYIVNILPLIPVEGTKFSDLRAPTPEERRKLTNLCSNDVKMMRHCRQCRADAIGLLGNDRSNEFIRIGKCGSGCGPLNVMRDGVVTDNIRIAIASDDGIRVNGGFGNTPAFRMFTVNGKIMKEDGIITIESKGGGVYGDAHTENIRNRIISLKDADMIIVKEIGPRPMHELKAAGKFVHVTSENTDIAIQDVLKAAKRHKE